MNRKGFTLIELITVIIILAILTLIIYPMVSDNIKQAQENNFTTLKGNMKTATELFLNECSSGTITSLNGVDDCAPVLNALNGTLTGSETLSTIVSARILLKYGLLKPSNIPKGSETESIYEIFDPRKDTNNLTDCLKTRITKGSNYSYTFEVVDECPNPYE